MDVVIPTNASKASSKEFVIAKSLFTCNNNSDNFSFLLIADLVFVAILYL